MLLLDSSSPLSEEDKQVLELLAGRQALVLINKTDLPQKLDMSAILQYSKEYQLLRISVQDGSGMDALEEAIVERVYSGQVTQSEGAYLTNVRHVALLRQAYQHLEEARSTIAMNMPPDCIVVDLRAAWEKLGEITGDTAGEDLLDQIFSRFCIGK